MAETYRGPAHYLAKFGEQTITGSKYALAKLGVNQTQCSLKIENYIILCIPFQLGFRRSIFLASLSKDEMIFFQKYINSIAVLSMTLNPDNRSKPVNFFIRCTLNTIGQMKGRENMGLFILDYKTSPNELVEIMGSFLESQERIRAQYEDYGRTYIKMNTSAAKLTGFNMYATAAEANASPRRIQVYNLNTKSLEYLEAAGSPVLKPETKVNLQLSFKKYKVIITGKVNSSASLPQGLIRTVTSLEYNPELVEILDDYWLGLTSNKSQITAYQKAAN